MKKIISLLLTMLLVLVPAAIATAEETESTVNISVDVTVYTVNVTAKTNDITSGLTLKLYPLTESGAILNPQLPVYLGECTEYTTVVHEESVKNETTGAEEVVKTFEYTYKFDAFNLLKSSVTGMYRVVINNTYNYDFYFVNKADKVEIYDNLADATAENMESVLAQGIEDGVLDLDMGNYFAYPADVKASINACLAAIPLPELGADPSDAQLQEYEEIIKPELKRLLTVAEFATAGSAAEFDTIVKANDAAKPAEDGKVNLELDLTYYGDKNLGMAPAMVMNKLDALGSFAYDEESVQDAFDTANLLALISFADPATITGALEYYDEKEIINLDTSLTAGFTDSQMNRLSQLLSANAALYNSAQAVENAYAAAASQVVSYVPPVVGGNGGTSGGGGGGGFAGSGYNTGTAPSSRHEGLNGSTQVEATGKETETVSFSDLGIASWATEAITALAAEGVVSGKGDGKFYPNDTVTREEFVKIIVEAFEIYNKNAKADFDDVAHDRWSYGHIASGVHAGIIKGINDTEFNPVGSMSRQDMAVIMHRVAKLLGVSMADNGTAFADDADIAPYAKEAVNALSGAGIINGTGNDCFSPLSTVTRAQAAKVVYELTNAVGGAK